MATMVRSMALEGIEGFPVEIEAAVIRGQQQMISIIGLGNQAVKESGERIQSIAGNLKPGEGLVRRNVRNRRRPQQRNIDYEAVF